MENLEHQLQMARDRITSLDSKIQEQQGKGVDLSRQRPILSNPDKQLLLNTSMSHNDTVYQPMSLEDLYHAARTEQTVNTVGTASARKSKTSHKQKRNVATKNKKQGKKKHGKKLVKKHKKHAKTSKRRIKASKKLVKKHKKPVKKFTKPVKKSKKLVKKSKVKSKGKKIVKNKHRKHKAKRK